MMTFGSELVNEENREPNMQNTQQQQQNHDIISDTISLCQQNTTDYIPEAA
jgi:hypothetical protein